MIKKLGLLAGILMAIIAVDVSAATYHDTFNEHFVWLDNEFISKAKDGRVKYQQMSMMVRKSDNYYVYCIEPGKSVDGNKLMTGYDIRQAEIANLTPQQWDRIQLLAYYGYGYEGHMDIKWYAITQFMIWQTNNLGYDIYFTDTLNGNRIEKYTEEMQELENLVNHHFDIPRFDVKQIELFLGETKSFEDINHSLEKYEITTGGNITVSKENNTLTVTSNKAEDSYIIFKNDKKRFYTKPIVYTDDENQNLFLPGDLSSVSHRIEVVMKYGKVNAIKIDSDNKTNIASGQASLQNAKYGLYNENNELLEEQYTDLCGNLNFNSKLGPARYYLQEITPSEGYQLDLSKYYFEVNKDNYDIKLFVYEKVIQENFEIIKVLENSTTGITEFEKNIEFGIYDKNNTLVNQYKTDENGTIKFLLPYGEYILKQHTSYPGYEKIQDYKLKVAENGKLNKLVFKDNLIKYRVKLNVKNKDTLENIENIEFKLYDKNNKEICYITNYPEETRICTYKTDKEGNILFPQEFYFSIYKIKLIHDNTFLYLYDQDFIDFSITEETEYKEIEDYRLVELEYFLSIKEDEKEPILETPEDKDETEETVDKSIKEEVVEEKEEEIPIEEIEDENELIVEVPNTLKNENSLLYLLVFYILIRKKITFPSNFKKIIIDKLK